MAFDGYLTYDSVEVINVARTALLARALGVPGVRVSQRAITTMQARLAAGAEWADITEAPWYDAGYAPSAEFIGVLPLSLQGLDESSLSSEAAEYTTDGGNLGHRRDGTQVIVGNFIFAGTTERGVEFGQRWVERVFRDHTKGSCAGSDLHYLRDLSPNAEMVHRRNVGMTRGTSITKRKVNRCSAGLWLTFTLTDADGYQYGEDNAKITSLGGATATGPGVTDAGGSLTAVQIDCPVYDYSPIYDPLYPALVAPPAVPAFLPDGWTIEAGKTFQRRWCRISTVNPASLMLVPKFKVTTTTAARMIRLSIWPSSAPNTSQCNPLFSVVITYLPDNLPLYIDAEAKVAYFWDGFSAAVRRADTVIFSPEAEPVEWASFNASDGGFLVTLDAMEMTPGSGTYQGGGNVRASLSLTPKSD